MENASFVRRIFSLVYDSLAIVGIIFSFTLLLVFINGGVPESGSLGDYSQLSHHYSFWPRLLFLFLDSQQWTNIGDASLENQAYL